MKEYKKLFYLNFEKKKLSLDLAQEALSRWGACILVGEIWKEAFSRKSWKIEPGLLYDMLEGASKHF